MDLSRIISWSRNFAEELLSDPEAKAAYEELAKHAAILIAKAGEKFSTAKMLTFTAAITSSLVSDGKK